MVFVRKRTDGAQLIQDLKNDFLFGVTECKPPAGSDKILQLHAVTDRFENEHVFLSRTAPWRRRETLISQRAVDGKLPLLTSKTPPS